MIHRIILFSIFKDYERKLIKQFSRFSAVDLQKKIGKKIKNNNYYKNSKFLEKRYYENRKLATVSHIIQHYQENLTGAF
jgi:hypothetical protein